MAKYTLTSVLKVLHTDTVEADSLEQAWKVIDTWIADDFTEDPECSRTWEIEIQEK